MEGPQSSQQQSLHGGVADEDAARVPAMSIAELRAFVHSRGLRVKTNTGNGGRTKQCIINEVLQVLEVRPAAQRSQHAPAEHVPADDLEDQSLKQLRATIDKEGLLVRKDVGGSSGRCTQDIIRDIKEARAGRQPTAAPRVAPVPSSRQKASAAAKASAGPPPWQVPCGSSGSMRVGGLAASKISLCPPDTDEVCFLDLLFGDRCQIFEQKVPSASALGNGTAKLPERLIRLDGRTLELVASKIKDDGPAWHGIPQRYVQWLYVATSGPELTNINIARELEKVADFASLPSGRKAASRLELILSKTSRKHFFNLTAHDFQVMETEPMSVQGDAMRDGCGFIPETMMQELYGKGRKLGLQVRIFGPTIGVFKGVLCAKQGIDRVQLPPSMRKVAASRVCSDPWVALLVLRVYPSTGSVRMAAKLVGEVPNKLPYPPKPLSTMLKTLWKTLGLPQAVIRDVARAVKDDCAEHAFVVGFGDPTDELPAGEVFVTGLLDIAQQRGSKLFVTRMPCVEAMDGQLLPCTVTRPGGMAESTWEWLCTLPFGAIIFSTSGPIPMPVSLSEGDLDGDLYFVSWSTEVLKHLTPFQPAQVDLADGAEEAGQKTAEDVPGRKQPCPDGDWFEVAQTHMSDVKVLLERHDIGRIYKAWERLVEEAPAGMEDADAKKLAAAYRQSLDRSKHGGSIDLPDNLKKLVKGLK